MPLDTGMRAYFYGSATGVWNVDWITFWGLMLFNTLGLTGVFENFRRWLISQGTLDIRVQTMLFAWAFGALARGPGRLRLSLGGGGADPDFARADRPRRHPRRRHRQQRAGVLRRARRADHRDGRGHRLSAAGAVRLGRHVVAVLALLPPWVLIYLVAGKEGFKDGWPLAIVGSLGYILGQWPVAHLFRAVPAGRDRLHRLLLRVAAAAESLAAGAHPRAWRHPGQRRGTGRGSRARTRADDRRGAAGLDAVRGAGRGCRGVDRSVVQPAGGRLVFRPGAGDRAGNQGHHHGGVQVRSLGRRQCDPGVLADRLRACSASPAS